MEIIKYWKKMIIVKQNSILHKVARKPGVEGASPPPQPRLARSLFAVTLIRFNFKKIK